jgi:hypothetical protein
MAKPEAAIGKHLNSYPARKDDICFFDVLQAAALVFEQRRHLAAGSSVTIYRKVQSNKR